MRATILTLLVACGCGALDDDEGCDYPDRDFTYEERLCIDFAAAFGGCCDLSSFEEGGAAQRRLLEEEVRSLLAVPRESAGVTWLPSGRVLVAGGRDGAREEVDTVEIVDPLSGTSQAVGRLAQPRADHTQILLGDGRVLIAGGVAAEVALSSCEIFDPETFSLRLAAPMRRAHVGARAFRLLGDRVLVIDAPGSAELFDPSADAWETVRLPE